MRDAHLGLGFLIASVGLHLMAVMAIWSVPRLSALAPSVVEVDIHASGEPGPEEVPGVVARGAAPLRVGGHQSAQNVDTRNAGGGGDGWARGPVILLTAHADQVTLWDTPPSAFAQSQLSRIRTARDRATQEDRRATPNAADQAWLATGAGTYAHRRNHGLAPAPGDPSASPATERGIERMQHRGTEVDPSSAATRLERGGADRQNRQSGSAQDSPGRGQVDGRGRSTRGADVALGRPPVDRGPAATAATLRDTRVRDNRDAEQLAAGLVQSFVDSSRRAGSREGVGAGGVGGGGEPGSGGGAGSGGLASALGAGGEGTFREDPRYLRWFLEQRRRVTDGLVFPHARQVAMDQGTSVYRVMVRRDGSLQAAPRLLHGSGYPDLDAAARRAIERALPFSPIPPQLAPEREWLAVRLAVEFQNPMVH